MEEKKTEMTAIKYQYLSIMSIDCWQVTDGRTVSGVDRLMQDTFFVHHLHL